MIITEYLLMAGKKADLKPACLNHILESIYPLLNADVRSQDKELQRVGRSADADVGRKEIRQLVLNLARNGLEYALRRRPDHCSAERSGQVVLEVIDQGAGIPERSWIRSGFLFHHQRQWHRTWFIGLPQHCQTSSGLYRG